MSDLDKLAKQYGGTFDDLAAQYGGTVAGVNPNDTFIDAGVRAKEPILPTATDVGSAVRGAVSGLASPVTMVADPIVALINLLVPGADQYLPSEGLQVLLTRLGVPEPKTKAQQILQTGVAGLVGGGSTALLSKGLAEIAPARTVMQELVGTGNSGVLPTTALAKGQVAGALETVAAGPVQQAVGGMTAGAAAESAKALGASPVVQLGAGLAGGVAGAGLGGLRSEVKSIPAGLLQDAKNIDVPIMTTDIRPPKNAVSQLGQALGELLGTGTDRAAQQLKRTAAVQRTLDQYDAGDLTTSLTKVTGDLLDTRKADLAKWVEAKNSVIDKLSYPKLGTPETQSNTGPMLLTATGKPAQLTASERLALPPGKKLNLAQYDMPQPELPQEPTGGALVAGVGGAMGPTGRLSPDAVKPTKSVGPDMSKVVPMTATNKAIDDALAHINQLDPVTLKPVAKVLTNWRQTMQGKDLKSIDELRAMTGDAFVPAELASVRSVGEKTLSSIYPAVKEDMTNYIKANGTEADLAKWQVANKTLAGMMDELSNTALKRVIDNGEATPEQVRSMVFSQDASTVKVLYRNLSPIGQAAMRAALLSKAAEQAATIVNGADTLSPNKFMSSVKKLGLQMGITFTGDDAKALDGLTRVLEYTQRAESKPMSLPTGIKGTMMLPVSVGALVSMFGGGWKGAMTAAGAAGAVGGLAKLYESPIGRSIFTKLPSVTAGSPEEAALLKRLVEAAQAVTQPASGGAH